VNKLRTDDVVVCIVEELLFKSGVFGDIGLVTKGDNTDMPRIEFDGYKFYTYDDEVEKIGVL